MEYLVLVGFLACSLCGLLLSIFLGWLDVRAPNSDHTPRTESYLERPLAFIFGVVQIVAFGAAIVSEAVALLTEQKVRCLDAVHFSTLQLYSGINLARIIRRVNFQPPSWATPLIYCISMSFALFDFAAWMKNDEMLPNYTSHLHLAIPPLLSAVVSCSRLHLHKSSGGRNPSLIRFLIGIISSSTLVVLCQLSGALVLLLMDRKATITHRYGILLACTSAQHLGSFICCFGSIKRGFRRIREWLRTSHPYRENRGEASGRSSLSGFM